MRRRDVLLLKVGNRSARLSCEQLYMRVVDAEAEGSAAPVFASLERELAGATALEITDRSWLTREDLKTRFDAIVEAFVARGGSVVEPGTAKAVPYHPIPR